MCGSVLSVVDCVGTCYLGRVGSWGSWSGVVMVLDWACSVVALLLVGGLGLTG